MRIRLSLIVSSLLMAASLSASPLPGSPEWDSGFDGKKALEHDQYLTSPECRGRYSGFAGSDVADKYIIKQFKALKLAKPFGDDGYVHKFTYGAAEYTAPSGLVCRLADGKLDTAHIWRELNIFKYSGFGHVKGDVVLIGYGISAPDNGWDDYAGIDVKGKIVLAWRGTPHIDGIDFGDWGMSGRKSSFALEKGAVGFLYCETDPPKLATIMDQFFRAELPAAWVSRSYADTLLKSTGKTKDEWKKLADSTKASISRKLDVTADLQVSGAYYKDRPTDNLAGLLIGSDPVLKNEVVVIGAHMDHHGVDPAGNLYPGADDNASGTSAMLELARVFASQKAKPKRSILFIGFAAEEEGLCGSKAFANDPRLPKGMRLTAMLNMDMVGQGNCSLGVAGINEFPLLGDMMFADWPDSALKALDFWGLYQGSDHMSFEEIGVPAYIVGARGDHPNYHTPGDSSGNIKPEVLKAVGDMMYHCSMALANYDGDLNIQAGRATALCMKYGGLKIEPTVNHKPFETISLFPYRKIKRAGYEPGLVVKDLRQETGKAAAYSALTMAQEVRSSWEATGIKLLGDSTLKGWEGEPYAGATMVIPRDVIKDDTLLLSALKLNGLGFLGYDFLWAHHDTTYNKRSFHVMRMDHGRYAVAGLPALLWHQPSQEFSNNFMFQKLNAQASDSLASVARSWGGKMLLVIDGFFIEEEIALKLADAGVFIQFTGDTTTLSLHRPMLGWLSEAVKAGRGGNFGIAPTPAYIQVLLDNGMKEDQIADLLIGNVRKALKRWNSR